jgi:3-deoxy-D-arabino-heptulosonate 7-phosphate (DAHP) synthase
MLPCARAAIAAGGDGLMIEIHNAPDRALSDGMQQMKLDDCAALVTALGLGSAKRASEGTA